MNGTGIGAAELLLLAFVAGGIFVVTAVTSRRWLWSIGLIGCAVVGVVNSPPDPMSTVMLAVQCFGLYLISAVGWNIGRRDDRTLAPDQ